MSQPIDSETQAPKAPRKKGAPSERKSRFSTPVDGEALEFIQAIEDFKKEKERPFPSWTEVFAIVHALGYRRVEERTEVRLPGDPGSSAS